MEVTYCYLEMNNHRALKLHVNKSFYYQLNASFQ